MKPETADVFPQLSTKEVAGVVRIDVRPRKKLAVFLVAPILVIVYIGLSLLLLFATISAVLSGSVLGFPSAALTCVAAFCLYLGYRYVFLLVNYLSTEAIEVSVDEIVIRHNMIGVWTRQKIVQYAKIRKISTRYSSSLSHGLPSSTFGKTPAHGTVEITTDRGKIRCGAFLTNHEAKYVADLLKKHLDL